MPEPIRLTDDERRHKWTDPEDCVPPEVDRLGREASAKAKRFAESIQPATMADGPNRQHPQITHGPSESCG